MSESPHQITRREILKRGAVVGGTVLWVSPVVQTLGMGRALAQVPSRVCTETDADQVGHYLPGETKANGPLTSRNDPSKALGPRDTEFVSLGYEGVLIVRLADRYYSGNSGSAVVVETTIGALDYPLEKANVFVSENTSTPLPLASWEYIGEATNHQSGSDPERTVFPLDALIPPPPNFRWVKLVDTTDPGIHDKRSDGFDVNSVHITCPTN